MSSYYADDLKEDGLSEERRAEILEALWTIFCVFIDLDIPIPAPDSNDESCGQLARDHREGGADSDNLVESTDIDLTKSFERAGADTSPAEKEES